METNSTQQEILLMTGSTFLQKEWCEKDIADNQQHYTQLEQLEEACWNGLLSDLLPEIIQWPSKEKRLWLWQIRHCISFLEIELCESEWRNGEEFSIDPYSFLQKIVYN